MAVMVILTQTILVFSQLTKERNPMKTLRLFIITVIAVILSMSLVTCKKDPLKNWVVADFFGKVGDTKVYDVMYNSKISEVEDYILLDVAKIYNDNGQLFYYVLGLPSSSVIISYELFVVDPILNRVAIPMVNFMYEDGSIQKNDYNLDNLEWFSPEAGSVSSYCVSLAKELSD